MKPCVQLRINRSAMNPKAGLCIGDSGEPSASVVADPRGRVLREILKLTRPTVWPCQSGAGHRRFRSNRRCSWTHRLLAILTVSVCLPLSGVLSGIEALDLLERSTRKQGHHVRSQERSTEPSGEGSSRHPGRGEAEGTGAARGQVAFRPHGH